MAVELRGSVFAGQGEFGVFVENIFHADRERERRFKLLAGFHLLDEIGEDRREQAANDRFFRLRGIERERHVGQVRLLLGRFDALGADDAVHLFHDEQRRRKRGVIMAKAAQDVQFLIGRQIRARGLDQTLLHADFI